MDNLDFLNLNSIRNYPIRDSYSRVSTDGLFTIPNDFIVDMSVSAPNNDHLDLYISRIVNTSTNINVEISVDHLGVVGNFYIDVASTDAEDDITLIPNNDLFPQALGVLTVGTLDTITALAAGEFTFDASATALLMRVFTPATVGVNYLAFTDSKGNQVTLTGHVGINAESNLQFRDGGNGHSVIIDAGENLGLNKNCDDSNSPIKTINGVRPDDDGNFTLIPGDCVSIVDADFGVVINDTCGKPCLGCNEIGTLTDRLVTVESDLLKMTNYLNNLQAMLTQLSTIVNFQCEQ
jgi:hypothetical protein